MAIINPPIPDLGEGIPTGDAKLYSSLRVILTELNGRLATANLENVGVADSNLKSPVNPTWRRLLEITNYSPVPASLVAGTYYPNNIGNGDLGSTALRARIWKPDATDLAVAGKTTMVRLVSILAVNDRTTGRTFTSKMRPITAVGGGAGVFTLTHGADVLVCPTHPSTVDDLGHQRLESAPVDLATLGALGYAFGFTVTGAAGCRIQLQQHLEFCHV